MLHRTPSLLEDRTHRAKRRAGERGAAKFRRLARKWSRVRGPRDIAMRAWSFVFDDTRRHEVHNDTEERRVVLLMHLRRPLREPGASLSRVLLGAIDRSPFVRDACRNLDAWEDALDAVASAPDLERLQSQL